MKIFMRMFLAILLVLPSSLHAAVEITEIMYDVAGTDSGREWVEIHNGSADGIDLSTWKFFEANVSHKIVAVGQSILAAGAYAVIADSPNKFKIDNPNFTGLVFDSAFSLSNEGETIALRDSTDATIDSVSYQGAWGAAGDGNTLQKSTAGVWISATPTVGVATAAVSSEPTSAVEPENQTPQSTKVKTESYSSHSSQSSAVISYDEPEFVVTSGRPRLGFVGVPLSFEARIKSVKNIPVTAGSTYGWSMGDATRQSGQFISHSYDFPGDYIVILNASSGGAEAVSKVLVRIVSPHLAAKSYDDHIEIENMDSHELNLGRFMLRSGKDTFTIPEDTIIAAHAKIRLKDSTTNLDRTEKLDIVNPSNKVIHSVSLPNRNLNSASVLIALPPGLSPEALKEKLRALLGAGV